MLLSIMGLIKVKNKKASVAVIFLVVSVLIVSSSIMITNEVKKSNNENKIVGTGLVLLNNEQSSQDSLSNSDSLNDGTKLFTFGDSGRKSSSKKSSGGGSSVKESSTVNEESNSLIVPETNETFGNQTSADNTEENQSLSESADIGAFFSDGQIFEENGTAYIVRDSITYALASSEQIRFNPLLPLSICVNEKIDIKIVGTLFPSLSFSGAAACLFVDSVGADIELKIMEADTLSFNDLINSKTFHVSIDCNNLKVDYSHVFENIDLSSEFGGLEDQGTIEVYALVKLTGSNVRDIEYSTLNYDVDKANCECLSGACCDLTSRPYTYKFSGSQPTGYDDLNYCSGVNSPTSTNYCIERDFYCSGSSAGYSYSDSTVDTCGICEYCTPGDPTCNYYSSSTKCGTRDCDYLDTTCRNYDDADRFCTGNSGTCKTASCTSYTDTQKGTSCGANNECDGSGSCITCTSREYYSCYLTNVYWYDACDNREDKKEDCGTSYESDWKYYCVGDDKWKKKTIFDKGCANGNCHTNQYDGYNTYVETCQYGCTNGKCNSAIACYQDSDCGTDGYVGDSFCGEDDVYQSYEVYTCNNPGTTSSYCSSGVANVLIQDCGENSLGSNYCSENSVYVNFTDRGCSGGSCFENTTEQNVEDCGTGQCIGGMCEGIKKPDLTITDLVIQYISERTVTLAFTVKNIGELAASEIYWMVDTDSSDTNPERTTPTSLDPGDWTRAYMMWTYSQSGTYQPEAIVDFGNVVNESNENNNRQSISVCANCTTA